MLRITVLHPAKPTAQSDQILLLGDIATLVQLGRGSAKVLLDAFAKQGVTMAEHESDIINTAGFDGEDLIIALQREV